MANKVTFNRQSTRSEALASEDGNKIFFPTDATSIVMGKREYGIGSTQQQSDWDETDETKVDYIKNKPTIVSESRVATIESEIQDIQSIVGAKTNIKVEQNTSQSFVIGKNDASCIIKFTPRIYSGTTMETGSYPVTLTVTLINPDDQENSGAGVSTTINTYSNIQQSIDLLSSTYATLKNHLMSGENTILVKMTYDTYTASAAFVATYTLLTFSCSHDWSKAWIQGETYGIGNIHFNGNLTKVLHVSVDNNEVPNITFTSAQNYDTAYYTFDLTSYFTNFAKTTGVHSISVWISVDGTELYRETYNIMCVLSAAKATAKLVCINEVNEDAINGYSYTDSNPLFKYATYGTTSVAFHVTAEDNVNSYSVDEQTREVVAETQCKYTPSLNISSAVDSGLSMTAVLTAGSSFNQSVTWDEVDNTNTYAATSGAVFYMNAQNRDNAESAANRIIIKNEGDLRTKDTYTSTWQNFSFGANDGWTTDDESNRCLAIPAGTLFSINDWKPLNLTATSSVSIEIKLKVQNIADYDTPILTIMDTDSYDESTTKGIVIFPTKVLVLGSGSNNLNQQMSPLHEDERCDIFIVFQRGYKDVSYNLCRIFINGVQNAIFEYTGTTSFGTGYLVAGQADADLYIYGIREYDTALEYQSIKNNFLSAFVDSATDETQTKNYIKNKNDLIAGSSIDYATAKAKDYNCMVIEMTSGNLPYFYDQTGGTCNVSFEWGDDSTKNVKVSNAPIEGQGTTSSKYFRWNFRWKCGSSTTWTYADATTTTKKGSLYGSSFKQIDKITAKKNVASSQQGHKMGATSLFNDLYKICVTDSDVPDDARVAVWQKPVLGFQKVGDEYVFIGHYTVGPDKGDKNTFGYNEDNYPDLLSLEGPNHTPRGTRFLAPWKSNTLYVTADEDLNYDGQQGWDVDYIGDDATPQTLLDSEWQPAYKAVFNSSQYIAPLADSGYSTLSALNDADYSVFQSGKTNGISNEYMTFYNSDYDLICFNYSTKKYEVVSGYNLLTTLGLTGSPTLSEIKAARQTYFTNNVPTYFNKSCLLFVKAFHIIFAVSDNDAKNSYPFKFKSIANGGKWEWREDDLDTLLPTDNNGNSTKKYSVETTDVNDEGSLIFQGSESVLWRMVEDVWADDLKLMVKTVFTAMQTLATNLGITGSSVPETLYNVVQYYFWSHSSQYFPMVTYNEDALWTYITPWYLNKQQPTTYAALYNSNVAPLTQALGDQLAAEKQFVMLRLAYIQSKFACCAFSAGSNAYGSIAMTTATSFKFNLTPAIDLYPSWNIGAGASSSGEDHSLAHTVAGDVVSFNSPASSNTTFYIMGVDWLSSLGDLCGLVITNRGGSTGSMAMDIQGARLTAVKFGDTDADNVKFNATALTIAGACIKTIEGRNASSVTGELNLSNCPRLQTVRLEGTSLQSVLPPMSSRVSTIGLPKTLTTLFLHTLPNLQTLLWEDTDRSNIEYIYMQNVNTAINPFNILYDAYSATDSKLKGVTMIWSSVVNADMAKMDMLIAMASNPYDVSTQTGYGSVSYDEVSKTLSANAGKANIQGTCNITDGIYEDDKATVEEQFPNLVLQGITDDNLYLNFADSKVEEILVADTTNVNTNSDSYISVSEAEACKTIGTLFDGNTEITSFDELAKFTGLTQLASYAFSGCTALKSISVPEGVTTINSYCFDSCTIDTIVLPSTLTAIWQYAFNGTVAKAVYHDADTMAKCDCYYYNNYSTGGKTSPMLAGAKVYFADDEDNLVTDIALTTSTVKRQAFAGMTQLTSVKLVSSVVTFNTRCFTGCSALAKVEFASLSHLLSCSFNSSQEGDASCNPLYVAHHLYFSDTEGEITSISIPSSVTKINDYAFAGGSNITDITIPSSVKSIGKYAFYYCTSLSSVLTIPSTVTSLGVACFANCSQLISVSLPSTVTTLFNTFTGCSNIENLNLDYIETIKGQFISGAKWISNNMLYLPKVKTIEAGNDYIPASGYHPYSQTAYYTFGGMGTTLKYLFCPLAENVFHTTAAGTGLVVMDWGKNLKSFGDPYQTPTYTIVRATTPPSMSSSHLNKLFVPAGCSDAYKTSLSTVASSIFEIGGDEWVTAFGSTDEYADVALYASDQYDEIKSAYENA